MSVFIRALILDLTILFLLMIWIMNSGSSGKDIIKRLRITRKFIYGYLLPFICVGLVVLFMLD
jgi:hypothetical protein